MNNFGSFSEDMVPRPVARPTASIPGATPVEANQPVPTVPELSFLDTNPQPKVIGTTKKAPLPPYSVWKKDNIVNWEQVSSSSAPYKPTTSPAHQFEPILRKQVTFDAPSSPPAQAQSVPATSVPNFQYTRNNPTIEKPQMCSQLELSAFDERTKLTATQMMNRFQEHPKVPASQPESSAKPAYLRIGNVESQPQQPDDKVLQPDLAEIFKLLIQQQISLQKPPAPPPPPAPEPSIRDFLQKVLTQTGDQQLSELVQSLTTQKTPPIDAQPTVSDLYKLFVSKDKPVEPVESPKSSAPSNLPIPEPTVRDLFAIIQLQQDQLTKLQQKVDHLMSLQEKENVRPSVEATPSRQSLPEQAHQRNEKDCQVIEATNTQPTDSNFYSNTMEQLREVLQNSPTTAQHNAVTPVSTNKRPLQQVFQVSHVHDVHFGNVNVSATQRLTIGTTANHDQSPQFQTNPFLTHVNPFQGLVDPPVTDRSLAMNTLKMKYLPNEMVRHTVESTPGRREAPKVTDMSTHTLNYLTKYGLLENRRLFTDQ